MKRLFVFAVLLGWALTAMVAAPIATAFVSTGDGGWVWQNPIPQGNPIRSIDFVDANDGWAVGGKSDVMSGQGYGMVLRTRDGGATWSLATRTASPLNAVCFLTSSLGWAVGDGKVLKTTDGGGTWTAQPSGTFEPLDSVCFVDPQNGWAVGGWSYSPGQPTRAIVHTDDGGATWHQQYYYAGDDPCALTGVDFVSPTTGWAVGADGLILVTTDAGVHWTQQRDPTGWAGLQDVSFVSTTTGWTVGDGGTVLYTTDAGADWVPQDAGTSADLTAVAGVSSDVACAVGDTGVAVRTTDGGSTWDPAATGTASNLTDVDLINANEGWTGGEVLHTTDGGANWQSQCSSASPATLSSTDFVSSTDGWAVGAAGTILHSTEGGSSWTSQPSGTTDDLNSVDFTDASNGWAVGGPAWQTGRVILHTVDGGATWRTQLADSGAPLVSVKFVNKLSGWAVGGPFGSPIILHTGNGGITWTLQGATDTEWLFAVDFVSSKIGWTLARDSAWQSCILRTTDGGTTWAHYAIPEAEPGETALTSMDFVSPSTGVVVGGYTGYGGIDNVGEIHRTTDGGLTWELVYKGTPQLSAVRFVDRDNGWAVGDWGCVLRTTDGGLTWQHEESGAAAPLTSICFVDATHGWAVGEGGTILATSTGGVVDDLPPVTSQSGADKSWHHSDRTVTLTATDPSGVDYTQYSLDGGPWTKGTSLTVAAPADHSDDLLHTLLYRSRDCDGNLEAAKTCHVKIDTVAPTPKAPRAVVVRRGRVAKLAYRVTDPEPNGGTALVTIVVKNTRGGTVASLTRHGVTVNARHAAGFRCRLARGRYKFFVYATDAAGNTQTAVAGNRLVVR